MKHLEDEWAAANEADKTAIEADIARLKEKAQATQAKVKAEMARLDNEGNAKVAAVQDHLKETRDRQKTAIEKRIADAKAAHEARKAEIEKRIAENDARAEAEDAAEDAAWQAQLDAWDAEDAAYQAEVDAWVAAYEAEYEAEDAAWQAEVDKRAAEIKAENEARKAKLEQANSLIGEALRLLRAEALFSGGVLTVTLPKTEETRAKQIAIKTARLGPKRQPAIGGHEEPRRFGPPLLL